MNELRVKSEELKVKSQEPRARSFYSSLITLYSLLFFTGCFLPPKMIVPQEAKTIFVSLFQNNTKEYGLSDILNLALVDEIMKGGNIRIEDKKEADLSLYGRIIDYKKTPVAWTLDKKITEYRLSISVEFEIFFQNNLVRKDRISYSIIYSDDEEEGKLRLLARISRAMVNDLQRFIKGYK